MATLALAIDARGALSGMKKFVDGAKQVKSAAGQIHDAGQKAFDVIGRAASIALGPLKAMVAATVAIKASMIAVGAASIGAAADYETLNQRLRTVVGSAKEADRIFRESREFAAKTPFNLDDVVETRIALEQMGVKGLKAVQSVGEASAAMGRNLRDVAAAVRSLEIEPMRGLGLTDTDLAVIKSIKESQGFDAARLALLSLFDKYEGGMARMSATYHGLVSTMQDGLKDLRAEFGAGFLPQVKLIIDDVTRVFGDMKKHALVAGEAFGKEIERARATILATFDVAGVMAQQLSKAFEAGKGWDVLLTVFQEGAGLISKAIMLAFEASLALWKVIGRVLGDAIMEVLYDSGIPGLRGIGVSKRAGDVTRSLSGLTDEQLRTVASNYGVSDKGYREKAGAYSLSVPTLEEYTRSRTEIIKDVSGIMANASPGMWEKQFEVLSKQLGTKIEVDRGYRIEESLRQGQSTLTTGLVEIGNEANAAFQRIENKLATASGTEAVDITALGKERYAYHMAEGQARIAENREMLQTETPAASTQVIRAKTQAELDYIDARKTAQELYAQEFSALQFEAQLIGKTNDERERAQVLAKMQTQVDKKLLDPSQVTAYMNELERLQDLRKLQAIADGIGNAFGTAFEDMVLGAKKASEAMKALAMDVARLVLRQMVTAPLAQSISSIFMGGFSGFSFGGGSAAGAGSSASYGYNAGGGSQAYTGAFGHGGIFGHGEIVPFATGGLVDSPSYFPLSRGRTGLMGENGAEAIMPLRRGSDGSLGVSGNVPQVQVNVINKTGRDVTATQQSQSFDGKKLVTNIVLEDLNTNGPIYQTMKARRNG